MNTINWKKSARSNGNGGNNCVEVADTGTGMLMRDSKNPAGPVLSYTYPEWEAFVGGVKDGEFDLPTQP